MTKATQQRSTSATGEQARLLRVKSALMVIANHPEASQEPSDFEVRRMYDAVLRIAKDTLTEEYHVHIVV